MHRCLAALVVVCLALAPTACFALDRIDPDPNIQAEIAVAANARNDSEVSAATALLRHSGGPQYEKLVPQLVYALMHTKDDRAAMAPAIVIQRLGISQEQIRAALEPYRNTTDEKLKRQINNLLGEDK